MKNNLINIPAVILAAGQGTRLLPLTADTPKPMIKIHDRPIIEYILRNLIDVGFRHFLIVTGYKSEKIERWIQEEFCMDIYSCFRKKEGENLGALAFSFIRQEDINGTGGAALLTEQHILKNGYSHFFLTYGDILASKTVYEKLIRKYQGEDADLYLVANQTDDPSAGAAVYTNDNKIIRFIEKPPKSAPKTNLGNAGIYIFNVKIFNALHNTHKSERGEVELTAPFQPMIESGDNLSVIKMTDEEFWCDVGNMKRYKELNQSQDWIRKIERCDEKI
mgnify:CR=1 FL=1